MAHGDLILLGLILERIKPGSEVFNLVLKGRRRTGDSWLNGRWRRGVDGKWRMSGGWVGWMGGRPHSGSPHTCQTRFGMPSTPPHPKVHDRSKKSRWIKERPTYLFSLRRS